MFMPCVNHAGERCPQCAGSGQHHVPDFRRGPILLLWARAWLARHRPMELVLVGGAAGSFVLWLGTVAWLENGAGIRIADQTATGALAVWVLLSAAAALGGVALGEHRRAGS